MRRVGLAGVGVALALGYLARRLAERPRLPRLDVEPASPALPRAELLTADQLELRARTLAAEHRVDRGSRTGATMLESIDANERILKAARASLSRSARQDETPAPAATWLLDNMYVVADQIREVRKDL